MNNIYIEGPNGIGKTTCAKRLADLYGMKYKHHTVPKHPNRFFMKLYYKLTELFTRNCVYDRCWYSELVYGPVYRGKSVLYLSDAIELNKFITRQNSALIVGIPYNDDDAIIGKLSTMNKRNESHPIIPNHKEYKQIVSRYYDLRSTMPKVYLLSNDEYLYLSDYALNILERSLLCQAQKRKSKTK